MPWLRRVGRTEQSDVDNRQIEHIAIRLAAVHSNHGPRIEHQVVRTWLHAFASQKAFEVEQQACTHRALERCTDRHFGIHGDWHLAGAAMTKLGLRIELRRPEVRVERLGPAYVSLAPTEVEDVTQVMKRGNAR
ncbi:hypothetical protein D3C77_209010 [compost metagenome]